MNPSHLAEGTALDTLAEVNTGDDATNKTEALEEAFDAESISKQEGGEKPEVGQDKMGDDFVALDEEKNPWTKQFIGIPINYFSVGVIYAGSVSVLYPILIIQYGVSSSFYTAAMSLVTLFWGYKIFFGMLCDLLPIVGRKWKPYIFVGWAICAAMLITLAGMGSNVRPNLLVVMLTLANLGYVCADVAADGYMVWMAHHESAARRGNIQTLIYMMRFIGSIAVSVLIIFGFSGPNVSCPGYETDPTVSCTTDEAVTSSSSTYSEDTVDTWCYEVCPEATFPFGLGISQFAGIIATVNLLSLPAYFLLFEDKKNADKAKEYFSGFWASLQKREVWQILLYTMNTGITYSIIVAPKDNANYVWLNLSNIQNSILNISDSAIFVVGLFLIRRYARGFSWRKMMWAGNVLVTVFALLYFLIIYDVWRNAWFYIFTDVAYSFSGTLNLMAGTFCIVEIAEPGLEASVYSLLTTANNVVVPLAYVVSMQLLAIFPSLNTQESIATDTQEVRNDFAKLLSITILINLSSLLALPLLPRQKKETKELVEKREMSKFWGGFNLFTGIFFLVYSTIVTFITVVSADKYGCLKIFGGGGCTEDESNGPVITLLVLVALYCYGTNFYLVFLPILMGKEKFSWSMFF